MFRSVKLAFNNTEVRCAIVNNINKSIVYSSCFRNFFHVNKISSASFHTSRILCVHENEQLNQKQKSTAKNIQIVASEEQDKETPFSELSTSQKVKRVGTDVSYIGIVVLGFGLAGVLFYAVGKELCPNGMYKKAYKLCMKNERVLDTLGGPVKAFGETDGRGRRRHVSQGFGVEDPGEEDYYSFNEFMEDNVRVMNIQFYLEGSVEKGKVFVEARQDARGKYQLTLVVLQINNYPRKTITVLDEKSALDTA